MNRINRRFFLLSLLLSVITFLVFLDTSRAHLRSKREFELSYKATISILPGSKELKVWVPLASSREGQEVLSRTITISDDIPYTVAQDPHYGNEIAHIVLKEPLPDELRVLVRYRARVDTELKKYKPDKINKKLYLKPSRLMVIDRRVREIADKAGKGITVTQKARGIYDYVIENMSYNKNEPGWGRGDTSRACLIGKGNCTDFHSLFISTAMASGIPARFNIGFTVPQGEKGPIKGYHCWAQFFDPEKGWQTVDASEAWKDPSKKDFYFTGFDINKFLLTIGRDIALTPKQSDKSVNIFFYPYCEVDGKKYSKVETEFYYRSIN